MSIQGAQMPFRYAFESFGARVGIRSAHHEVLTEVRKRLDAAFPPGSLREIDYRRAVHKFGIGRNSSADYVMYRGRERVTQGNDRRIFLKFFESSVRLAVAEYALNVVFVHAGVVAWKGAAIVIPARSFAGKTTLVRELVARGAIYYSDEYAVIDPEGLVHPFPKPLSLREIDGDRSQRDVDVRELGGVAGSEPVRVGLLLLTSFENGAVWRPEKLTPGMAVLEMLSHAIPATYNPEFTLKVLNNAAKHAIIVKTKRGEADGFAVEVLNFLEDMVLNHVIIT